MRKSTTYRNKIELLLGITIDDVAEIWKNSPLTKQRQRQLRRWAAHKRRKDAS